MNNDTAKANRQLNESEAGINSVQPEGASAPQVDRHEP